MTAPAVCGQRFSPLVASVERGPDQAQSLRQGLRALNEKLEQVVLPLYYSYSNDPGGWIKVMKAAISKNASYFNSHRLMRRYATQAYIR